MKEMETPFEAALYRANRLKTGFAVDLCCGTGNDSLALAKTCKKVMGFDISPKAIYSAKKKAERKKIKNAEFYCQDCFSVDLKKLKPNLVFADPARRRNGERSKGLSDTEPSTLNLIAFIKDSGVKDFCIEASSNLPLKAFPQECEKELISINNAPNCTSLYFGGLKQANYSVVVLPEKKSLKAEKIIPLTQNDFSKKPLRYLFELDKGIIRAGMQGNLIQEIKKQFPKIHAFKESLFTSDNKALSPFFTNTFRLVGEAKSLESIKDLLVMSKAGKVVVRGKFKDQKEQLVLKQKLSAGLKGNRKIHVFYLEDKALVLRNTLL